MSTLRDARKRKGITATELGAAVGVSERSIRNFEANDEVPRLATALRISEIVGIPVEELAGKDQERPTVVRGAGALLTRKG